MSNLNNKTFEYKKEIKDAFKSLEPGNNGIIETKQLNDLNKLKIWSRTTKHINSPRMKSIS